MPFVRAAASEIALSNASGPSRMPPVICPRSAILHSAAASSVAGIFGLTVSTAERIATFGVAIPRIVREIDRVPADVRLVLERGEDVDRGIGHRSRRGYAGTSMHEDMRDAARRAQSGRGRHHGTHQLVRVQASLHQRVDLARRASSTALSAAAWLCSTGTISIGRHVDALRPGNRADLRLGSDEHGDDQAALRRLDRPSERIAVARDARRRRSPAAALRSA